MEMQLHREALLESSVELVDAGDAGAHDQHIDVGRDGFSFGGCHAAGIVPTG